VTAPRAKRENGGSGGGSTRKCDDLLTGPCDLDVRRRRRFELFSLQQEARTTSPGALSFDLRNACCDQLDTQTALAQGGIFLMTSELLKALNHKDKTAFLTRNSCWQRFERSFAVVQQLFRSCSNSTNGQNFHCENSVKERSCLESFPPDPGFFARAAFQVASSSFSTGEHVVVAKMTGQATQARNVTDERSRTNGLEEGQNRIF
jgi:hypothetical protein